MRILISLMITLVLLASSCAGTNKRPRSGKNKDSDRVPGTSIKTTLMPATPIKEVEEKLVPNDEKAPDPHKYFVIIGSFRDPENAREHQAMVLKEGFKSEVLKNEAGLFRVSVMATDDIAQARNEVRRIWSKFPGYADTWMLISK